MIIPKQAATITDGSRSFGCLFVTLPRRGESISIYEEDGKALTSGVVREVTWSIRLGDDPHAKIYVEPTGDQP